MTEDQLTEDQGQLQRRVTHIESQVTDIKSNQAALKTQMASINQTVVAGFAEINNRLNQPQQKTPVTAYISAGVAVLVLLGAIGASNLYPLHQTSALMTEVLSRVVAKQGLEAEQQEALISVTNRHGEWLNHLEQRIDSNRDIAVENAARLDERND